MLLFCKLNSNFTHLHILSYSGNLKNGASGLANYYRIGKICIMWIDINVPAGLAQWTSVLDGLPTTAGGISMDLDHACGTAESSDFQLNRSGLIQTNKYLSEQTHLITTICYLCN